MSPTDLTSSGTTAAGLGGGPSPGLARLWAGWRTAYLDRLGEDPSEVRPDDAGQTLFERIWASSLPDDQTHILWRGTRCFAVLNAYPYGSGHLLVLPQRAAADLADLDASTAAELWAAVQDGVAAVRTAYEPDGVNVGLNLGHGAGAGVPDHLHVHVLPRWSGDTNYMTTVAETRVLPEPLAVSGRKLREAWPVASE